MSGASLDVTFRHRVLTIKGCLPHYRRPLPEIVELRERIYKRLSELMPHLDLPLTCEIHLRVVAKKHADGGDLSNILQAVVQAIDGNTLGPNKVLADDKQIAFMSARWIP